MFIRKLYCKWPSDSVHHFMRSPFRYKIMALGIKYSVFTEGHFT